LFLIEHGRFYPSISSLGLYGKVGAAVMVGFEHGRAQRGLAVRAI
jgi:hypothetical protein